MGKGSLRGNQHFFHVEARAEHRSAKQFWIFLLYIIIQFRAKFNDVLLVDILVRRGAP